MRSLYNDEPVTTSRRLRPKPSHPYNNTVKHEPINAEPRGDRVDAAMIARAREELAAGIGVEHAVVGEWLKTWGTPSRKPFKEWLAAWNG